MPRGFWCPFCAILFSAIGTALPVAAQPALSRVLPTAAKPGATIEWTLQGSKLSDPLQIWTSFGAQVELPPAEGEPAARKCKVTLPADAVVGVGGILVANPRGISEMRLVLVDDLPSLTEAADNNAPQSAQAVTVPAAIDGTANGPQPDYFQVAGKAGQRIAVEIVAARIGSNMDPVMRLLDPGGQELRWADDDESLGADCRFEIQLPSDGTYLIEVRDSQYRSGGTYRLRIGDFPLVSVPYPLGGRLGSTARFQFTGPSADQIAPVFLRLPEDQVGRQLPLGARLVDGQSSAMTRMAASDLPELTEVEPNDVVKVATPVTLPCAINGLFAEEHDTDCFQFAAKQGQQTRFRAVSRSLGSPSLLYMQVTDGDGKLLVETKVSDADEFSLDYTFPADGMYVLKVRDLLQRGGSSFGYRVEAGPHPGFELSLKADSPLRFAVPDGDGAVPLNLQIARQGYDGPIRVEFDQPMPLRLMQATIPEKATEHQLIVAARGGAPVGSMHAERLHGTTKTAGASVEVPLDTSAVLRTQLPELNLQPGWLQGLLVFAITSAAAPVFDMTVPGEGALTFDRAAGNAVVQATLQRTNAEFKDAVLLDLQGLPPGFAHQIKQEELRYDITITGPADADAGEYPLELLAYGQFKGRGQVVTRPLLLKIPPPAAPAP